MFSRATVSERFETWEQNVTDITSLYEEWVGVLVSNEWQDMLCNLNMLSFCLIIKLVMCQLLPVTFKQFNRFSLVTSHRVSMSIKPKNL